MVGVRVSRYMVKIILLVVLVGTRETQVVSLRKKELDNQHLSVCCSLVE